jgi:hypothetical protein
VFQRGLETVLISFKLFFVAVSDQEHHVLLMSTVNFNIKKTRALDETWELVQELIIWKGTLAH